jgi:hypothetical protein
MSEIGSEIGGEGNGGVMLADVHIGRDAVVTAALTLQHLAHFKVCEKTMSLFYFHFLSRRAVSVL